jgi:hypothetical protein
MPRWYYDVAAGECLEFVYGGCQGNANDFQTADECATACAHRADTCSFCVDGNCVDHDCTGCPETRDCSGTDCALVGQACVFLPSCGATTCTCKAEPGESPAWECIPNLC